MSNITFLLQEKLKEKNDLYQEAKYQEILHLVKAYKLGLIDNENYEMYFNRKCLNDYKNLLMGEIANRIEKNLSLNKQKNAKIYKVLFLFRMKAQNGKLENYLKNTMDSSDLLDTYTPYISIKKRIDLKKEMKDNKSLDILKKEQDTLQKNIIKISSDSLNELYIRNELDYKYIVENINEDEMKIIRNLIFNMINNHNDKLDFKIGDIDYLDLLIELVTKENVTSFYDFVTTDDISNEYSLSEELSFFIIQYKYLIKADFKMLMNLLVSLDDDEKLTISLINKILDEEFDDVSLNKKTTLLIFIFINILDTCEMPENELYLEYLKRVYIKNNKSRVYEDIVKMGNTYGELLDSVRNLFTSTLIGMKKKKDIIELLNNILKYNINKSITKEEYELLISDIKVLRQIIQNKEDTYELLTQHISRVVAKDVNTLVDFGLVLGANENISDLTRKLKSFGLDDQNIKKQLRMYEIQQRQSSSIYIQAPNSMKNGAILSIFLKYNEWMNRAQEIKKYLGFDLTNDIELVFQNILSKCFSHFIHALTNYLDMPIDEQPDYRDLYYYYEDNKKIKVHTSNIIEDVLLFVKKELGKNLQGLDQDKNFLLFIVQKINYFLTQYKYFSNIHEREIVLFDLIKGNQLIIQSLYRLFDEINDKFMKQKVKPINILMYKKILTDIANEISENLYTDGINRKKYQAIVKVNMEHNIFSESELRYIAIELGKTGTFTDKILDDKKNKILESMQFYRMVLDSLKVKIQEEYKFNILKNKGKEEKRIVEQLEKQVYKLLKEDIKAQKMVKYHAPAKILIQNEGRELEVSSAQKYQANEVGYIEMMTLRKYIDEDEQEKIEYKNLIQNLVKGNFALLNKIFELSLDKTHEELVIENIVSNNLKVKAIQKKMLFKIKLNKINEEKMLSDSILNDVVKELCILYFVDKVSTIKDITQYFSSNKLITFESTAKTSIIGKNVLILSSNKYGKVISKVKKDTYKVQISKQSVTLERNKFILIDSLKHKMVYIKKGLYKGQYGYVQDYKIKKVLSKSEEKAKAKQIRFVRDLINRKTELIEKLKQADKTGDIIDNEEMRMIISYRKKELNRLMKSNNNNELEETLDKQKLNKLKLNIKLRKVIFTEEKILLENHRVEKIHFIKFSIRNLDNELKGLLSKSDSLKRYIITIRMGQKNQRNVLFSHDEIKLNLSEIEKEEKLSEHIQKTTTQHFQNVYELIKYLFFNLNISVSTDDMNKIHYYHILYKNAIALNNEIKILNINKIKSIEYLKSKLEELEQNEKKIKKKLTEKKSKKLLDKFQSNKFKKELIQSKLQEGETKIKTIEISNILLKDDSKILKLKNDMNIEKIGSQKYILFKENKIKIQSELDVYNKHQKVQEKKSDIEEKNMIENILLEGKQYVEQFLNNLNVDVSNCNLLNKIINTGDFEMDAYYEQTAEEIEEDDAFLANLEAELDILDEDSSDELTPKKKTPKQKPLTWLELDEMDEDSLDELDINEEDQ
jgi:hypothetical protein